MKQLNFFAFLVAIAFVSCAKSDAPTPTTAFVAPTPVDVSAIIIGTWHLSDVGTLTPYTGTGTSSSGGGCGNSSDRSSDNMEITWSPTTDDELLSFAKNGDFVQLKQAKTVCKGTYRLNMSTATLTNDCSTQSQNVSNVSEKSLTLDNGITFLHFDKVSSNPQ
jgi:hypothetical protein